MNQHTYGTGIYQMRCTAYKVAPDDGLIQSKTCRASKKKKSNHKTFVYLVGLYTYCKMMRGAYNVKFQNFLIFLFVYVFHQNLRTKTLLFLDRKKCCSFQQNISTFTVSQKLKGFNNNIKTTSNQKMNFQARPRIWENRLLASSCRSLRPSVRLYGTIRLPLKPFYKLSFLSIFRKSIGKIQV